MGLVPGIGGVMVMAGTLAVSVEPGDGAYRGSPRMPPPGAFTVDAAVPQAAKHGVVFVNFDGAQLQGGDEDATQNATLIGWSGSFAAYGAGSKRDAVLQAVRVDWAAYDVEVGDVRPGSGAYTMAMVGPTNFTDGSLGVALLDCNDSWTHANVVYAFHRSDDGFSAAATATTVSQEVAHSYGLEHVDEPADIMHPFNVGGDAAFVDRCLPLVPAPDFGILCRSQHEAQCGATDAQNGHGELLSLFGTSAPDTAAPTVWIEAPTDGTWFAPGDDFTIDVAVADDRGVVEVQLFQDGAFVASDDEAPLGWRVDDVPEGIYRFEVDAVDAAGNTARSGAVVVMVGGEQPDPGPSDPGAAPESDGDPGGSDGSDDPADRDPSGDGSSGPGIIAFEEGCACGVRRLGDGPGGAWAWLCLWLWPRPRRRVRCGAP